MCWLLFVPFKHWALNVDPALHVWSPWPDELRFQLFKALVVPWRFFTEGVVETQSARTTVISPVKPLSFATSWWHWPCLWHGKSQPFVVARLVKLCPEMLFPVSMYNCITPYDRAGRRLILSALTLSAPASKYVLTCLLSEVHASTCTWDCLRMRIVQHVIILTTIQPWVNVHFFNCRW